MKAMKLSNLAASVKAAQKFCKDNKVKDPIVVVDMDENGFYNLEELEADTDDRGKIVINLKTSNEL